MATVIEAIALALCPLGVISDWSIPRCYPRNRTSRRAPARSIGTKSRDNGS